jgi:hypothetical protein
MAQSEPTVSGELGTVMDFALCMKTLILKWPGHVVRMDQQ